jgi:hypothetical protein
MLPTAARQGLVPMRALLQRWTSSGAGTGPVSASGASGASGAATGGVGASASATSGAVVPQAGAGAASEPAVFTPKYITARPYWMPKPRSKEAGMLYARLEKSRQVWGEGSVEGKKVRVPS